MHHEILTDKQLELLPLLKQFRNTFGLVGGTALALHLGHRRSIDFDFCTSQPLHISSIRRTIVRFSPIQQVIRDEQEEYTILVQNVRLTFFHYPFPIRFTKRFDENIRLPNVLTLAAMKAYTLGRRAKWKDYVDIYFVMKQGHSINAVVKEATRLFQSEFSEKIFRAQLSYFKDIDYSERVEYMNGYREKDSVIQQTLKEMSVS